MVRECRQQMIFDIYIFFVLSRWLKCRFTQIMNWPSVHLKPVQLKLSSAVYLNAWGMN